MVTISAKCLTESKDCYQFSRVNILTLEELSEYFEIEKPLYLKIFGSVSSELKDKFIKKRTALFDNPNYYNYKITNSKNQLCGYISFLMFEGKLYLYDITFNNENKRTRLLLETIKFALNIQEFQNFNRLYFAVDNRNDISYKTWLHLGSCLENNDEIKSAYYIEREAVVKYIDNIYGRRKS